MAGQGCVCLGWGGGRLAVYILYMHFLAVHSVDSCLLISPSADDEGYINHCSRTQNSI